MALYTFTEKEMTKVQTMQKRDKGILSIEDVCVRLGCSRRTAYRYKKRFREKGPPGILHGLKGKKSNNSGGKKKLEGIRKYIEKKKYRGFGPTILQESLLEELGRDEKDINVETLRLRMIERGLRVVKPRNIRVKRQKRERRAQKGMMIQFDGSYHDWLEDGREIYLLLGIDDATGELMGGMFSGGESLEDMLIYRKDYFERFGKPESIYIDCHATYKVNHAQDQFDEEKKTRFARGMQKLGIQIIYSKCPEGKGRIERSFKNPSR